MLRDNSTEGIMAHRDWKVCLFIIIFLVFSVGCGSSKTSVPIQSPPTTPDLLPTVTLYATNVGSTNQLPNLPSVTRAPTPNATQQAAPTIEPDLGGFIRDYFLAVILGDDAKARTYLAPSLFPGVANLRDALGIPAPPPGGPLTIDSRPVDRSADRLIVETTIQSGQYVVVKRLTLECTSGYWQITSISPTK